MNFLYNHEPNWGLNESNLGRKSNRNNNTNGLKIFKLHCIHHMLIYTVILMYDKYVCSMDLKVLNSKKKKKKRIQ